MTVHLSIFISVIIQLDVQNFCFTISLFHASTCFEHMCSSSGGQNEHMCSKHVEAWNKLIVKQKFCASIWLITEINEILSKQLYEAYIQRYSTAGEVGTRSCMCHGGWEVWVHGVSTIICYVEVNIVRSMVYINLNVTYNSRNPMYSHLPTSMTHTRSRAHLTCCTVPLYISPV